MRTSRAAHLLSQRRLRATAAEAHPHLERWHEQKRTRRAADCDEASVRLPPVQPVQGQAGHGARRALRRARLGVAGGGWRTGNASYGVEGEARRRAG